MKFIKSLFSSCLGTMLGMSSFVAFFFIIALMAKGCGGEGVKPNTVLSLSLKGALPELDNNLERGGAGDLESLFAESPGLQSVLDLIAEAKADKNIKGILINLDTETAPYGFATLKKIHAALTDFRSEGKFIIAYGNVITQRAYYLASAADKIYLNPQGGMDFRGFGAQYTFFKGALDKLGVKTQVFYAGKFKSATEPFRRTDMSPENRLQVREYVEGAYDLYLGTIAEARKMDKAELRRIADEFAIRRAQDALDTKMVDGLKYRDEVLSEIRENLGLKDEDEINSLSLGKYYELKKDKLGQGGSAKNQIALVVAEGTIVDGEGESGQIGGERYARIIRQIRRKKEVKAIVLRVNSGGGSALASELIWREIMQAKAQGLPVVVSMGDVAASGGYYIAAPADKIFAEDNTLTGSIGVFGLIPNWRELMESKLGLTMDTVRTGRFSTMDGTFYGFDEQEAAIVQQSVDDIYLLFKQRVGEGRKMELDKVDEIAQGRVWLGNKAKEIGLVDELGGLKEAIAEAAKLANLEDYKTSAYPKTKSFFDQLLDQSGSGDKSTQVQSLLDEQARRQVQVQTPKPLQPLLQTAQKVQELQGVQARLPFELFWN